MANQDRKTWNRDCSDMSELELITWKSTNGALEDIHLLGVWEIPHEFPYTPTELDVPDTRLESFLFKRAFEKLFTWYFNYARNIIAPKIERMEVERSTLFDELPFADQESKELEDEISTTYSHLPFPGDQ